MIQAYLTFLHTHPLLSSAVQVGILGMFGELLAVKIRGGKWYFFGPGPWRLLLKFVVWAFLGITFKYAFAGFVGFVDVLTERGFWFAAAHHDAENGIPLLQAFSKSFFTNILFGPCMMLFHRWTDNAIEQKEMHWPSLQKAWWTLLWFWIPAHTITFSLPDHLQVGLAAVWAIALGVILGFFARGK